MKRVLTPTFAQFSSAIDARVMPTIGLSRTMAQESVHIRIHHLDTHGVGVGRSEHFEISVPGTTPGDIVEVSLEHKNPRARYAEGRILRVIERGPGFVQPPCHHAAPLRGKCGGCPLMHLSMETEVEQKNKWVEDALSSFPGYQPQHALQPIPADQQDGLHYRNRAIYTVFRPKEGRIHLGSRRPGHVGFAKMAGCLVNHPVVESVAQHLADILNERHIPVYPARSGLRYVVIRSNTQGDALVELICAQKSPGWLTSVQERLREHPNVRGIFLSVNRQNTNVFRLQAPRKLEGQSYVTQQVGSVALQLAVDSFFQLNVPIASAMYQRAAQTVHNPRVIWDLYCGVGGLGLNVASAYPQSQLFGCEITESAVHFARKNAELNGIQATYVAADLSHGSPAGWADPDVVLVNPPRRGLDKHVLQLLTSVKPRQIGYMSCSVESLHNDLNVITRAGYRIRWHGAWNMLPHTEHVEVLVVLDRDDITKVERERPRAKKRTTTVRPQDTENAGIQIHKKRYSANKSRRATKPKK